MTMPPSGGMLGGPTISILWRPCSDGGAWSGAPTYGVIHVERAPEGHCRLRAHACLLHHRPDVRLGLLKEGLKTLGIGPLVHGHVLAIAAVPAMRDEPVPLGASMMRPIVSCCAAAVCSNAAGS